MSSDWSLDLVTYPMTILIGGIGFSAAILGNWITKVGPRYMLYFKSFLQFYIFIHLSDCSFLLHCLSFNFPRRAMFQGSLTLGCGYGLASYAICSHNIYLLYPSVAMIAFGTGSLYTPPIQTMIDWFPER